MKKNPAKTPNPNQFGFGRVVYLFWFEFVVGVCLFGWLVFGWLVLVVGFGFSQFLACLGFLGLFWFGDF